MTLNKIAKNEKISLSIKLTKEKRKSQICKSYIVKIDRSHLNSVSKQHLQRLFLEAKWFYNYVISRTSVYNIDYKISEVPVKVRCAYYIRPLLYLSSQMKQSIIDKVKTNIRSLSTKKNKHLKIGKLKYKSEIYSIPLRRHGNEDVETNKIFSGTYRIINKNHIYIQKLKQHLKVSGLSQIPLNSDIANANLIHKNGDYYLQITTFQPKPEPILNNKSIGIDFGISSQLTLSNGIKINYNVPISKKLKSLHQKLSKQKQFSKNWYKTKNKLNKEYQYLTNIKQDIKNKIVYFLKSNYDTVCFQDESLKAWQTRYGKKIQSTSLGGIISTLKQRVHTPNEVDRFYPSTKNCHVCQNKQSLSLDQRIYICSICNNTIDRDLNSSLNIELEGLKQLKIPWYIGNSSLMKSNLYNCI